MVPRRRDVFRGVLWGVQTEIPCVWRNAPRGSERWRQLARILALAVAVPLGQHHGLLDAQRARREPGD